jgi:hypothetical protein
MVLLILFWKLGCKEKFFISKDEFILGLSLIGLDTIKKLKTKIPQLRDEIKNIDNFKAFYLFLFEYMKSNQKKIDIGKI